MHDKEEVFVSVASEFHRYVPASILRLRYIYPGIELEASANGLTAFGVPEADRQEFEREVTYQVYREKVFQETLPMRQSLYQMLAT